MGRRVVVTAVCLAVLLCASGTGSEVEAELREQLAQLREQVAALSTRLDEAQTELGNRRLAGVFANDRWARTNDITAAIENMKNYTVTKEAFTTLLDDFSSLTIAADHMWLILCGALVMFMQAGFAMVESGSCRVKNAQNVLMKNLTDVCIGTICWYGLGWGLAYGKDKDCTESGAHMFAGNSQFFGAKFIEADADGNMTPTNGARDWFFQWAFCSASATIVSGAVAERVNFPAYAIYTVFMTSIIYPIVVSWTWGYGFLTGCAENTVNEVGFFDFAGSGIVHMCGGVAALVGAIVVGPRNGRFAKEKSAAEIAKEFQGHSQPLIVLGTFILWFGWYGFNCGSTLAMSSKDMAYLAAMVGMNTTLSAATCGITVLLIAYATSRKYDVGTMCNGILAGLVSITAPCANVEHGTSVLIGFLGAFVFYGASKLLKLLKIDDPVDAFAVHGACGAWGVLAAALFDWGKGVDYYNGYNYFGPLTGDDDAPLKGAWGKGFVANLVEVIAISAWVAATTAIILVPLRVAGLLRADDNTQEEGMDAKKHSPPRAYVTGNEKKDDVII